MRNLWQELPKPFFTLAPLEDVTDAAFRRLIASYGKPHVFYTEFTSADGLLLANEHGQKQLRRKLLFSEIERPIVAQLFTSVPEHMQKAARIVAELGFDGIDINMGCPDRAVEKSGCGAALIKTPALARQLIRAAKEAGLPVSVKTRLGYNTDELETWLPELLAEEPAAVAIHARTRKELSEVPARWERIARAVEIRDAAQSTALIIGNGDVKNLADARAKVAQTGCDGVMLGRAIFGNPWLFACLRRQADREQPPSPREKIDALIKHLELFDELLGDVTNYAVMKKHFKAYISGWDGAKDLRMRMMETNSMVEAIALLRNAEMSLR
ncbi:MAG TPA: tRNA-dihydrouridine synthase [Candidatus Paceibacterota bacterium]|nr:tRNA-dihydrouridine synthase [Candidatus Paceibacterota bacterium]